MSNNLDLGARILEAAAHCMEQCMQAVSAFFVSMFAGEASYTSSKELLGTRSRWPHYVYAGFAGFLGFAAAKALGANDYWVLMLVAGICAHGGRVVITRMEKIRDAKLDAMGTQIIDRDKL